MIADGIRNKSRISRVILCLLLAILLAAALPGRGTCAEAAPVIEQKTMPDGTAGSVIMDAAALFFMSGILIYTSLYRKRGRLDDKLFFGMVLTNMALAASDAIAYLLEGRAFSEAGIIIVVCNVIFYAAFAAFPYLFLLYLDFHARRDRERIRRISTLYSIPCLFMFALLLINLKTGWLYSVSEKNIYHSGPYNNAVFVPVVLYVAVILVKLLRLNRRLALLGVILILSRVAFGIWFRSISSTAMTYTLFLVATHIYALNRSINEEMT